MLEETKRQLDRYALMYRSDSRPKYRSFIDYCVSDYLIALELGMDDFDEAVEYFMDRTSEVRI